MAKENVDKGKETEILIVTQNEDIAELLPSVLELVPDTHITAATNVTEAEGYLSEQSPDLIVIDLDWPHVFDPGATLSLSQTALARLRACANCEGVPIIGLSSELSANQLKSLNLTVGIRKPFAIFDFVDTVEHTLRR